MPSFRCDELAQHLYAVLGGGEELRPEQFPEAVIKVLRSLGRRDCLRIVGGLTERSHQARCFQLHPNLEVRPGQAQRPLVDMRLDLRRGRLAEQRRRGPARAGLRGWGARNRARRRRPPRQKRGASASAAGVLRATAAADRPGLSAAHRSNLCRPAQLSAADWAHHLADGG